MTRFYRWRIVLAELIFPGDLNDYVQAFHYLGVQDGRKSQTNKIVDALNNDAVLTLAYETDVLERVVAIVEGTK